MSRRFVTQDGRTFQGTDTQIVRQMQSLAFGLGGKTMREYTDWVSDNTLRVEGIALKVTGQTDDGIAASLLSQLCLAGLGRRE